jgi:hypothetical protein
MKKSSYLPAYGDGTECSETSAYKIQPPGHYPEESIRVQHSKHGESLKSKRKYLGQRRRKYRKTDKIRQREVSQHRCLSNL